MEVTIDERIANNSKVMQRVKFKEIFSFGKKSKIKAGEGYKLGEGKYPFYTSSEKLSKTLNEFLFSDESLIFGTGGLASIHHCNEKFAVSTDCFVTQPIDLTSVYAKYVYFYLSGNIHLLENGFKGAGLKHISKGYIEDLEIPLPSLPTQKKIAEILDTADQLRQYDKQLIEKYDALTQSLFLEMFGDPVKNEKGYEVTLIRELCSEVKYGTSEKSSENGVFPYLRMNNITYKGYMDFSNLKKINISEKDIHKYLVKKGDILFNRTNSKELVGKTGLITTAQEYIIAGYLIRIRTNQLANPYYIWAHLNSKWSKATLNNMCKNIVGMANINAQELQNIQILKAPISLQNQFAERVQMIETQKEQAQESLAKSEYLFQSLLQRAFNGTL